MRFWFRLALYFACLSAAFFLFSISASTVSAGANVSFDFNNNGNSGGTLYFTIRNGSGSIMADTSTTFSGNQTNINGGQSWTDPVDNPTYTITWEPVTPYSQSDFRDVDCKDPVNTFDDTGIVGGGDTVYVMIDSFSCYIPSPPPAPTISVFFECSGTNAGIRITSGAPAGIYDIYWRIGGGNPRDGVTLGVLANGPYYSGVTVGSFPYSNYTFTPGNTFSVDVLARNSSSSVWSSNGWMTGTIPSGCGGPPPTPPGAFSIGAFFECSGPNAGLRITGGPASGATGYKIYWTSSGDPIPGGYITTVGSLPYTNYTFSPGGNFLNVDVAATNANGDTQSSNGWLSGTVPTTASCSATPTPTPTPTPIPTPTPPPLPPTPTVDQVRCSPTASIPDSFAGFRATWSSGSYWVQVYSASSGGTLLKQTTSLNTSGNFYPNNLMSGAGSINAGTTYYVGLATTAGGASGSRTAVNMPLCPAPASNLLVTSTCPGGVLTVTFTWTDNATNESGYYVDVTTVANGWGSWAFRSLGANSTSFAWNSSNTLTANGLSIPSPAANTAYYWRVQPNLTGYTNPQHVYYGGGTTPPGTSFNSGTPCNVPSSLTIDALSACSIAPYNVTFRWTNVGTPWTLQVSNNNFTSVLSSKDVSNVNSTVGPAGFVPAITFNPGTTYTWRIQYQASPPLYAPTAAPWPTFSTPGCVDLRARFVQPFADQVFNPGDPISLTVRVKNVGNVNAAATTVGLWLGQSGETAFPACPTPGGASPQSQSVAALAAGAQQQFTFNFTAPTTVGTYVANAYVVPNCSNTVEPGVTYANWPYWPNNATNGVDGRVADDADAPVGGFTYTINVDAWFEAKGGDVGAGGGGVTMGQVPPSGSNAVYGTGIGKMLLAATGAATAGGAGQQLSTFVAGITITGYNSALMPAGVYNYLADRYRSKATTNQCAFTSLGAGLSYCVANVQIGNGDGTITNINVPAGNIAWFIDGNLTITDNIVVPSSSSIAFIVSGNITVNSAVSNIQGIYVAGGPFTDVDASGVAGPRLEVNGAVYAGSVSLPRKLGGACATDTRPGYPQPCNNVQTPAESFVFDPKYLANLNTLIGTPAVNWQEVAP